MQYLLINNSNSMRYVRYQQETKQQLQLKRYINESLAFGNFSQIKRSTCLCLIRYNQIHMKYRIIPIFLILALFIASLAVTTEQPQEEQPTTQITFYVEEQDEQEKDFIELVLEVKHQDSSLVSALAGAGKTVEKVIDTCAKFCESDDDTDDSKCEEMVDVGNYQIKPKYQTIRKIPTFIAFIVTHEIKVTVANTEQVGALVDKLMACGIQQITQFQWKPNQESDPSQAAFENGLTEGKKLCRNAGKKFSRVVEIQQVIEQEEQQPAGGEQQQAEEQEEEEQQPTKYKFVVECVPK